LQPRSAASQLKHSKKSASFFKKRSKKRLLLRVVALPSPLPRLSAGGTPIQKQRRVFQTLEISQRAIARTARAAAPNPGSTLSITARHAAKYASSETFFE
jgi:hypothetical protein